MKKTNQTYFFHNESALM